MILIIDNYDSFVHNLGRYLRQLGKQTTTLRNDQVDVAAIAQMQPAAIILSPGPCDPDRAGCCLEVVQEFWHSIPILGVCLGHQVIVQAFGGDIVRAGQPMHGRASEIRHTGSRLFQEIPETFTVGRYHSLIANPKTLPDCLSVTSNTADSTIMSVEHTSRPVVGVQFHPESILTQHGHRLIRNFLELAGCLARLAASDIKNAAMDSCDVLMSRELAPTVERP